MTMFVVDICRGIVPKNRKKCNGDLSCTIFCMKRLTTIDALSRLMIITIEVYIIGICFAKIDKLHSL